MPYIPTDTDCSELNPGMCGGKMQPTMLPCNNGEMLPNMCGDNALYIPPCREEVACFEFTFTERPPLPPIVPGSTTFDLMTTLINNCDMHFAHSTLYHYGVKNVSNDAEYDVDTYGLAPEVTYYSQVYFIPTTEELQQGYKDITYTIEATTAQGRVVVESATYRYNLPTMPPTPTCLVKGTQVWTDDGLKNIEDISVGDTVLAYDEVTESTEYARVQNTIESEATEVYEISIGGEVLKATGEHRLYSDGEYKAVSELSVGDEIRKQDGTFATVESISVVNGTFRVCNLEVEVLRNYFAGDSGFLSYNMNIADKYGVSTILLSPKSFRSVGGTVSFSVGCVQNENPRHPIGTKEFSYSITPIDDSQPFDNSVDGIYYFSLTGVGNTQLRLSLTNAANGTYKYNVAGVVVPTPCVQAAEQYTLEVVVWEGTLIGVTIKTKDSETKHDSMTFTPTCDDPYSLSD